MIFVELILLYVTYFSLENQSCVRSFRVSEIRFQQPALYYLYGWAALWINRWNLLAWYLSKWSYSHSFSTHETIHVYKTCDRCVCLLINWTDCQYRYMFLVFCETAKVFLKQISKNFAIHQYWVLPWRHGSTLKSFLYASFISIILYFLISTLVVLKREEKLRLYPGR